MREEGTERGKKPPKKVISGKILHQVVPVWSSRTLLNINFTQEVYLR
jgi:hypothetical protein